jgi:hypothetical protein
MTARSTLAALLLWLLAADAACAHDLGASEARLTEQPGVGTPSLLRARPEIIESTSDRVNIEFTTTFSYHIWWL